MFCSNCGSEVNGNFCSNCGAKIKNRGQENDAIGNPNRETTMAPEPQTNVTSNSSEQTKKRSIGYYIKAFVIWYITAASLLSGVSVIVSGVSVIAGILWFLSGLAFCPKVLPQLGTILKIVLGIILFLAGVNFMPA